MFISQLYSLSKNLDGLEEEILLLTQKPACSELGEDIL